MRGLALTLVLLAGMACAEPVHYPGATWQVKTPAELGLNPAWLSALAVYVGGRGVVVRGGFEVYRWGDPTVREDVASVAKPLYTHFLLKAVEDGRVASLDEPAARWKPCLNDLDPEITLRHLATQTSCYGVRESPGTAFDYSDWQTALLWDALFLGIYATTTERVDRDVLHPILTDLLECEDQPTFLAFGPADRAGRLAISPRDLARFGLLYLRGGNWQGRQLLAPELVSMAVSRPLPLSVPRTRAEPAGMCPGQRTIGSDVFPDDQRDHDGSYSYLWWTNGVTREGLRHWPDAPHDAFGAVGHRGRHALLVLPDLGIVVAWSEGTLHARARNPLSEAIRMLVLADTGRG